jgi:hypothetical protein
MNTGKWSGRLASVEDRIAAIEMILSEKGLMRPQTKQAKAINFIVANQAALEELIEGRKTDVSAPSK